MRGATALTNAAGAAAVAAGLMFIGVQINHPELDANSITTPEVYVPDSLKVLMAVLALVGITGMYLSQIRRRVLGLVGYVLLAAGYLLITCGVFAAAYVFPRSPGRTRVTSTTSSPSTPAAAASRATSARCKP